MQREIFEVKRERFNLHDEYKYILQGNWPKDYQIEAFLDNDKIPVSLEEWKMTSAMERFENMVQGENVTVTVALPQDLIKYRTLKVVAVDGDTRLKWYRTSVAELLRYQGKPYYYLEEVKVDTKNSTAQARGWVIFDGPVSISVEDEMGQPIPHEIQMNNRVDVSQMYEEYDRDDKCGFFIEVHDIKAKKVNLIFNSEGIRATHIINMNPAKIFQEKVAGYYKKGMRLLKTHGVKALGSKAVLKVTNRKAAPIAYSDWIVKHLPSKDMLSRQRQEIFAINPKFSVVVPLYKTPEKYLDRLVECMQEQTYDNWELCLSDGSGASSPLTEKLQEYTRADKRIKVVSHKEALQISENTNSAIAIATGDYIVFADHDDELTANALYECVKAINADDKIEIIYSDEDKMSMDGNKYFQPHFKPDFNIDLLCTVNYICHLFVVKREIIDKVGVLCKSFDGAQDYDFILRCIEGSSHIYHIPKILYHWRSHEDSTAENPESKLYAFEAGVRAVQAHYDRIGVKAKVSKGEYLGLYRTKFIRDYDPLISIIIPNKDHIDDLKRCINSIEARSTYKNYEYIIVENNSTEDSTFAYYKELEAKNDKVKVVYWDGIFNYAAINNFGAKAAKGEYLWLLNNDTEIINDDCLEELLGYCMREDVGIVGARLYYEDDTIQHAGVVIGFGGMAGHCFVQQKRGTTGYCHRIICAQDYSAVTAACMLVKRTVFDAVGGLTESFAVAFNDIDFCLKVRKLGKLVVYNPYAELYHYESKSRGLEDTPEKVARFNTEIKRLEDTWPEIFEKGDPYYNQNLTLDSQDFSLRKN